MVRGQEAIRIRADTYSAMASQSSSRGPAGSMKTEEQFQAWLARLDKEPSKALESKYYGDPAKHIKFDREKGMERIKDLLREWACFYKDGLGGGYPKQAAFATERVDGDNRSTETYRDIPAVIVKLNDYIENSLAPNFKVIVHLEYLDRRPQKTKAAVLKMARSVYCARLTYVHEQLNFAMYKS